MKHHTSMWPENLRAYINDRALHWMLDIECALPEELKQIFKKYLTSTDITFLFDSNYPEGAIAHWVDVVFYSGIVAVDDIINHPAKSFAEYEAYIMLKYQQRWGILIDLDPQ